VRRVLLAGITLVTLAAIALLVLTGRPGRAAPVAEAGPLAYRFAWPSGSRYLYDLSWTAEQKAQVAEAGLAGSLGIEGRLALRSFGERDGATLLGLSFVSLARPEMRLAGKPLLGDDASLARALVGPEAFVEIEPTGKVRGVRFAAGAPPVFQQVVMGLVGELEVTVPAAPAARWSAALHTLSGEAKVEWRVRASAPARLARRTLGYEALHLVAGGQVGDARVDGDADVTLAAAGHVEHLAAREQVAAAGASSRSRLGLELRAVEAFDPGAGPDLTGLARATLGQPISSPETERRLLEARVGDMTAERFLADLDVALAGGTLADHDRWLWQAVGLLQLHPELCARLPALFADAHTDARGRALVMDLLASAGSAEAQAALREILAGDVAHADHDYGLLLQRTSLLAHPDGDTVDLVTATMDEAASSGDAHTRYAAAWSLGAMAGKVDDAGGERLSKRLADALAAAGDGEERAALLGALGNTGRAADAAAIVAHAGDADPDVRAAALRALHHHADDQIELLFDRLGDAAVQVKAAALMSLGEAHLGEAHYARLAACALSGVLPPALDGVLLDLVARQPVTMSPGLTSLLTLVIGRHDTDPSVAARARALLVRLTPGVR
jgi:hypothetical protein